MLCELSGVGLFFSLQMLTILAIQPLLNVSIWVNLLGHILIKKHWLLVILILNVKHGIEVLMHCFGSHLSPYGRRKLNLVGTQVVSSMESRKKGPSILGLLVALGNPPSIFACLGRFGSQ